MKGLLRLLISIILLTLPLPALALNPYERERHRMVEYDLKGRDITDQRVLTAMGRVPRHLFVDESLRKMAYNDHPLPIGEGQTISQPYIVALMTQVVGVKKGDKVLEIGTGSGYQAAILAELTDKVYTIEIRKGLADRAKETLKTTGYLSADRQGKNILIKEGDGYFGWKEYAPFDAILVTAAANHIPPPLIEQLKEGGRLVIPIGSTTYYQTLTLIIKHKGGELDVRHITSVAFVPMAGEVERR